MSRSVRCIAAFLGAIISAGSSAVEAPPPYVVIPERLAAMEKRLDAQSEALAEQRRMLDALTQNVAVLVAHSAPVPTPEEARAKVGELTKQQQPFKQESSNEEIKLLADVAKNCQEAAVALGKDLGSEGRTFTIPQNCLPAQAQQSVDKANEIEKKLRSHWDRCRAAMEEEMPSVVLPSDASSLTTDQINSLGKLPWRNALQCADDVKDLAKESKDIHNLKKTLAKAFALMASVCYATGGTGCAAYMVIAVFLDMFGGGDGDGNGNGEQIGDGGGPSSVGVAGAAQSNPRPGGDGLGGASKTRVEAPQSWGTDPHGPWRCVPEILGRSMNCSRISNPHNMVHIAIEDVPNDSQVVNVCAGLFPRLTQQSPISLDGDDNSITAFHFEVGDILCDVTFKDGRSTFQVPRSKKRATAKP